MNLLKIFYILICCLTYTILPAQQKPNIIYIYADDLGYNELGCYGQQKIKTPNIDRMATEGMQFMQHYSGAPVCAPSRCMLMTGKHAGHAAIRGNYELGGFADSSERGQMPLPANAFTIADMLKKAGYTTALCGKWGLGMNHAPGSPLNHGFDYYYGYLDQKQAHNYYPTHLWENDKWDTLGNSFIYVHKPLDSLKATDKDFDYFKGKVYAPDKITEKAVEFIKKNRNNPFFLYLPYTMPHVSLQVPDAYLKKFIDLFNETPYYGQNGYAATKYPRSAYAALISYLDDQVGIILQAIKNLGLDENTLIMFSSDNGTTYKAGGVDPFYFESEGKLKGVKMDLYEGGIRMPFIARWPNKIAAGKISQTISAQYDIMPTLAELVNQKNISTDGVSLLSELLGKTKKQPQHEYLYFEYPDRDGEVAIRLNNWKGIKTNIKKNKNAKWQLYNLLDDVGEKNNVAEQHPEIIKKLNEIVLKEHHPAIIKEWEMF
ncbi:MAG: arylsulfatase [Bacteroidetes bacterium]|nr:arylsulfatase [Bacteroidota bacterium]